jgi:dihydrofolate reductase
MPNWFKTKETKMSKLRVAAFSVSLDGFGAGPDQSLQNPLGVGGKQLHQWAFRTRTFQAMFGTPEKGETGVGEDFAARSFENVGAWILGRNMFAHSRGPWTDDGWKGWWGEEPPYHCDVFVLTHYAREALPVGETTFHFVTDGIESALRQARAAAQGKDVRLGGGVATIREYLRAGLIDEMHLAFSPVLLGQGERLLDGIDLPALGFTVTEQVATPHATHVVLTKSR